MATPTKNIATNIVAITPSFRGAVSVRICLCKSSWSCRSIRRPHLWFHRKRAKTAAVSLTSRNGTPGTPGSSYWGANRCSMVVLAINSTDKSTNQHRGCGEQGSVSRLAQSSKYLRGAGTILRHYRSRSRAGRSPQPLTLNHPASDPGCSSGWGSFFFRPKPKKFVPLGRGHFK
jgi:hypothetical protein